MKQTVAILILAGAVSTAIGDTADVDNNYFHPAASLYIHGDTVAASNLVTTGLSLYPGDAKLKRLKDLLEQQEQNNDSEQNQEQQKQNNQNQQNQDEQNGEQEDRQNQQEKEQEQNQQEQNQEEDANQDRKPRAAEEMTGEEARQLLDAMKQEEKNDRRQLHPVYGAPVKVDKDW